MNSSISIASQKDIPSLVSLINSAYRGEGSKQGWTTEADLLDGIRTDHSSLEKQMSTPGAAILTYSNEEYRIIGCVYLEKQGTKIYLGMLTVAPDVQAKGIGKQLLSAAEDYAREQGCTSVTMTVISVRSELIAWYERHGYTNTGEKKPFPKGPEFGIPKQELEFIVMAKHLPG